MALALLAGLAKVAGVDRSLLAAVTAPVSDTAAVESNRDEAQLATANAAASGASSSEPTPANDAFAPQAGSPAASRMGNEPPMPPAAIASTFGEGEPPADSVAARIGSYRLLGDAGGQNLLAQVVLPPVNPLDVRVSPTLTTLTRQVLEDLGWQDRREQDAKLQSWTMVFPRLLATTPEEETRLAAGEPLADRTAAIAAARRWVAALTSEDDPTRAVALLGRLAALGLPLEPPDPQGEPTVIAAGPVAEELAYRLLGAIAREAIAERVGVRPRPTSVLELAIKVDGDTRTIEEALFGPFALGAAGMSAGAGFTLLPPDDRIAATPRGSSENLRAITQALQNEWAMFRTLPTVLPQQGAPPLSWRVHMLRHLGPENVALYERFALDEPWDSETNRPLIAEMPAVYRSPAPAAQTLPPDQTTYRLVTVADETGLWFGRQPDLRTASDGWSATLAVVEVGRDRATVWTQPDVVSFESPASLGRPAWQFDRDGDGRPEWTGWVASRLDTSRVWIPAKAAEAPASLRAVFTARAGDIVPEGFLGPVPYDLPPLEQAMHTPGRSRPGR